MKKCSELQFGFIDAQSYLRNPNHPNSEYFRKSFFKSKHLKQAVNPDIYYLLGEKGTGKTAYAVYATLFMNDEYNAQCDVFDTNDFTRFIEVCDSLRIEKSQFSRVWVFLFLLMLIQKLKNRSELPAESDVEKVLSSMQVATLGSPIDTISNAIEATSEINASFEFYAEASNQKLPRHVIEGAKPIFKLNRLSEVMVKGLSELPPDIQLTIFVDGLDVRPDVVSYPDYLEVVSSIVNANWVVNATQLAKLSAQLKITLLVRPDIMEAVSLQNRGPKIQHHGHLVEWATAYKDYRESEIFKFTDIVLFSQQSENLKLGPGDTWNHYFPFRVESRVKEEGDNPFVLFLRHSFYKPRDIIKYLSLMQEFYSQGERKERLAFEEDVFWQRDIRKEYSSYLMQEIRDQLSFYYTNDEYQQFLNFNNGYLGNYIDMGKRTFSYESMVAAHAEYLDYNKRNNIQTVPSFATADQTLQFMFDLNVLGYWEEKTLKSGDTRIFTNYSFTQRSFANLRPKVPTSEGSNYVMHYGVAKSLFVQMGR